VPDGLEIKIADLSRVALEPGDVLLARVDGPIDMAQAEAIRKRLKWYFPGHDVVVVDGSVELSVVRPRDTVPTTPGARVDVAKLFLNPALVSGCPPEEVARRFAEANDRPEHMGRA